MVAFALIGLAPESWRGGDLPGPRTTSHAAVRQTPVGATRPSALRAPATAPAGWASAARPEQSSEIPGPGEPAQPADEPEEPTLRLPSELAPLAPDIIVALPLPSGPPVVLAHAHVADGAHDEARQTTQEAAAAPAGDDVQGPEPGAFYWFGPRGLERLQPLGEAPR
jgi:hypothetical protein